MDSKILIIHNPRAGKRKKINLKESLQAWSKQVNLDYDYIETQYAQHAPKIVKESIKKGYSSIIAAGGDGTVNEIASALIGEDIALGILPMGSGNGLARHHKIPMNIKKAFLILSKGNTTKIDAGNINGKHFFCAAGIGFDALVSKKFASSKTRGLISYFLIAFKEYFSYKSLDYFIQLEEQDSFKKNAFFITFANANQFGNHAYIAPQANINDGKLDVCILKPFSWYKGFVLAHQLFNKKIQSSSLYKSYTSSKILVSSKNKIPFHTDGELIENESNQVEINIIPKALNIIVA